MHKRVVHEFNMAPMENLLFRICIVLEFLRLSKNYALFQKEQEVKYLGITLMDVQEGMGNY